jgi:hypothetical protein
MLRKLLSGLVFLYITTHVQACYAYCAGVNGSATTYTLDSLVFASKSAVVAKVGFFGKAETVEKSIYGDLKPGDIITSSILRNVHPALRHGDRLIVFLDADRTVQGFYYIDDDQEVRRYLTNDIFCPDMSDGWNLEPRSDKLPKLPAVEQQIDVALAYRPLINTFANLLPRFPETMPFPDGVTKSAVLDLLKYKCTEHSEYDFLHGVDRDGPRGTHSDSDIEQLATDISDLNDPEFKFVAAKICPQQRIDFPMGGPDLRYLTSIYESKTQDVNDRIQAATTLSGQYRDMNPQSELAEANAVFDKDTAVAPNDIYDLYNKAIGIFEDETEDARLRVLSLDMLDVDRPDIHSLVAQLYSKTKQSEVKHAIESKVLFRDGDAGYEALNPPNGPVSTFVHACPVGDMNGWQTFGTSPAEDEEAAKKRSAKLWLCADGVEETEIYNKCNGAKNLTDDLKQSHFVITNVKTGNRRIIDDEEGSSGGNESDGKHVMYLIDGQTGIASSTDLPAGNYELSYEFSCDGKVIGNSYPAKLEVVSTLEGNILRSK